MEKRRIVALFRILVFLFLCIGYLLQAGHFPRRYFILFLSVLALTYVGMSVKRNPKVLKHWGLRFDNTISSLKLIAPFLIVTLTVLLVISRYLKRDVMYGSFFMLLPLYMLWGIAQQFVFQSFLNNELQKLFPQKDTLVVLLTAVVFSFVHVSNWHLVVVTFFAGIFWSYFFVRIPNVVVIGVSHGFLGSVYYYFILSRDVLSEL